MRKAVKRNKWAQKAVRSEWETVTPRATTGLMRLWGSYTTVSSGFAGSDYRNFWCFRCHYLPFTPNSSSLRISILVNSILLRTVSSKQHSGYIDPIFLSPRWETNQWHLMWALMVQLKGSEVKVHLTNASGLNTSDGDRKTPGSHFSMAGKYNCYQFH